MAKGSEQIKESGSYQTHRVQFLREITSRTDNTALKDEDFLNCIFEPVKNRNLEDDRHFIMKRAGSGTLIPSVAAAPVRGMHFWDDFDKLFYCVQSNIYIYDANTGLSTTLAGLFTSTSGTVGFCEYLYDNGTTVVIVTDGTKLYQIDSSGISTLCTDADLPTPHIPSPTFIDGYLFLAKSGTADVYNSDLNNPLSWTPGNFISAEMRPDLVVNIAVLNNYLIVFGTDSIEYFWDAANATGSPMQRNDTPIKINRYIGGFTQYGNDLFYIGENDNGQPTVFRLKDFKIDELGSNTVSRYLNTVLDSVPSWNAGTISLQGHSFYILSVGNTTYVGDVESKFWGRWAFQQTPTFPVIASARITTNSTRKTCFAFSGNDSTIYYMSDLLFQDNGVNFTYRIVTEAADFGNLNRKYMARFSLIGDRPPVNSNVSVSWSDDDYQSYSNPLSFNMNQDLPCVYRLGQFRQRAFKIEYTDNYPFRLQRYEADINKGIS
jgi:hypothetical protein